MSVRPIRNDSPATSQSWSARNEREVASAFWMHRFEGEAADALWPQPTPDGQRPTGLDPKRAFVARD